MTLASPRAVPRYIERYGYAFSWRRLWNAAKVIASMGLSWSLRRPIVWGRPFMLMVEPTNLCNLKCPCVPRATGRCPESAATWTSGHYKELIDETGNDLVLLLLWNQGEPFINKGLAEMIRYAHEKRIPRSRAPTATSCAPGKRPSSWWTAASTRSSSPSTGSIRRRHERYRVGGKLERVLGAARLLAAAKRERSSPTPRVNLQFIVFRHNEEDLAEAERLARELEADQFLVKTAQVYSPEEAATFLPEQTSTGVTRGRKRTAGRRGPRGTGCA